MLHTNFISNNTTSSIDSIKTLAFYFDKVTVARYGKWYLFTERGEVYATFLSQFESREFEGYLRPLVDANVVSLKQETLAFPG